MVISPHLVPCVLKENRLQALIIKKDVHVGKAGRADCTAHTISAERKWGTKVIPAFSTSQHFGLILIKM